MMHAHHKSDLMLSVEAYKRIDEACSRFEAAWRADGKPQIEDYLAGTEAAERQVLLRELICLELELRRDAGERPNVAAYERRFDSQLELVRAIFESQDASSETLHKTPLDPAATLAPGGRPPARSQLPVTSGWQAVGYEVVRELGRGGMGVVYLARHLRLNRPVALKTVLGSPAASPRLLVRFLAEGEHSARLRHPNIVQVYEVGQHQGRPFLALEYIEGGTLSKVLGGRPLPALEAAAIVEQLASAVHHAHQNGIVHRDLKPANILMASGNVPKITDFGLARQLRVEAGLTGSGEVLGTPAYMAPEQARGDARHAGPTADIYALGAILYECLTGKAPFGGPTPAEVLVQVLNDPPAPLAGRVPPVPADLEAICLRCLKKDPQERYSTGAELAEDLHRFREGQMVAARPMGIVERGLRWVRRHPAVVTLLLALLLSSTTGLGLVSRQWQKAEAARLLADERANEESKAREQAEHAHRLAGQREARLALDRGLSLCDLGDVRRGLAWLVRALELAETSGDKDLERAVRINLADWQPLVGQVIREVRQESPIRTADFHPESQMVATGHHDGYIRLWRVPNGEFINREFSLRRIALLPTIVHSVAFSPDGKTLFAGSGDGRARLWDVATGQILHTFTQEQPVSFWDVAFSPDGATLAAVSEDGTIRRWLTSTGNPVGPPVRHGPSPIQAMCWTADGKFLVTGARAHGVRIWDAMSGEARGTLGPATEEVYALDVSPDSRTVLVGGRTSAQLYDLESRLPIGSALSHTGRVEALAFAPGGNTCVTADHDGYVRTWTVATSQPAGPALRHDDQVRAVRVSRDGKTLLVAGLDGVMRFWEMTRDKSLAPPLRHPSAVLAASFSPSGAVRTVSMLKLHRWTPDGSPMQSVPLEDLSVPLRFASFSPDDQSFAASTWYTNKVRVWDMEGKGRGPFVSGTAGVSHLAYHPEGKSLLTVPEEPTRFTDGLRRFTLGPKGLTPSPWTPKPAQPLCAAFTRTGPVMVGCRDRMARLCDAQTGGIFGKAMAHTDAVTAVALAPDGRTAITGCRDGSLRLWDLERQEPLGPPFGPRERINALAFSPDGSVVLSAGADRSARFWDVKTGTALGPALRHLEEVNHAAFSRDGRRVVTASSDGTARIWQSPAAPVDEECSVLLVRVRKLCGMEIGSDGALRLADH